MMAEQQLNKNKKCVSICKTCVCVSEQSIGGKTCKETIIWGSCGGRYRWLSKNCEKWRWICGGRELISKDVALVLNVSMALH